MRKGKYLCRLNLAMDSWSIWILLIVENWKYYSKIILKCVNNTVGPNFKEKFVEICTCWSCEQCMRPTQKNADAHVCCFQCNPNIHSMILSHTKSNTWRIYCQKKALETNANAAAGNKRILYHSWTKLIDDNWSFDGKIFPLLSTLGHV